jgi:tyrosyl-tRNA synthetase
VVDLFITAGLAASRGEARRLIQQGGARINGEVVQSFEQLVTSGDADAEGVILLRAGKKRFFRFSLI